MGQGSSSEAGPRKPSSAEPARKAVPLDSNVELPVSCVKIAGVFDDFERATKGVKEPDSTESSAAAGGGGAGAAPPEAATAADADAAVGGASAEASSDDGKTEETKSKPSESALERAAAPHTPDATASTLIVLDSPRAAALESSIMRAVMGLMHDMQQVGLTAPEMAAVRAALEEDGDEALERLRTLAVSRRFDARQGAEILQDMGRLNPFDKVEAAVLLHGALMDGSSFKLLLEQFEDEDERDNVCARLGLRLDDIV